MKNKKNIDKVIIDLCGGTGAWSQPYVEAGYTVHNITLPDYDIMKTIFHYGKQYGNELFHFNGKLRLDIWSRDIYGILAAPPCAHFSIARTKATTPRNIPGAFELVKKCREIIEKCAIYGNLKFWCLENPKGLLSKIIGRPAFKFERWHFGDPGKKITFLWGCFNSPKMKPDIDMLDTEYINSKCYYLNFPEGYNLPPKETRKKVTRAMTPPRFANAFFKANK